MVWKEISKKKVLQLKITEIFKFFINVVFEQTEYLNQLRMQIQFIVMDDIGSRYSSVHGDTRISSLNNCRVLMAMRKFKLTVLFFYLKADR